MDAASLVVSRDKENSSCNRFWRKRWQREPLRVPRATRTRSFDPYWLISSMVRSLIHTLPNDVGVKWVHLRLTPHRTVSERRQVESARRASAGCRRTSSDSRRGWGRMHQFVAFPSSRGPLFHNSTHCTAQLDSGAHSPHKAWPLRTRHLANPNQKLGFSFLLLHHHRGYRFFSINR